MHCLYYIPLFLFFSPKSLSSHDLAIEKGRNVKPKIPLKNRLCKLCNMNTIEEEDHMLLLCSFFDEDREMF